MKLIPFSIERKKEFMEDARKNLLAEYAPEKAIGDPVKRNELKHIVDGILKGEQKGREKAEAKRIALNTFFKELTEVETDINDLLS